MRNSFMASWSEERTGTQRVPRQFDKRFSGFAGFEKPLSVRPAPASVAPARARPGSGLPACCCQEDKGAPVSKDTAEAIRPLVPGMIRGQV
jgi:hypothetical protein